MELIKALEDRFGAHRVKSIQNPFHSDQALIVLLLELDGPGHTIPTGNPEVPISDLMQQEYFIFLDPILLQKELSPVNIQGKTIHFLSIVPIFGDELDFKMGKGTQKFVRRFIQRNYDEKLDDYRKSVMNSRLRFF